MSSVLAPATVRSRSRFLLGGEPAVPANDLLIAPRKLFPRSREGLRVSLYALLIVVDLTMIAVAFGCGGAFRLGSPFATPALRTIAVVLPMFLAIAAHNRAYSIKALQRPAYGAAKATEALGYALAVAIALLFYAKESVHFSRQIFAIGTVLSVLLTIGARLAIGAQLRRKFGGHFLNRLVILDGMELPRNKGEVTVLASELGVDPDADDPLLLDRLGYALQGCDCVVVACAAGRRAMWSHALKSAAVNVELVTPELDELAPIGLGQYYEHRTMLVSARPLDIRDRALKRALDLAVAVPAVVLLSPVMLVISCAIAIESRGPVLFRQQRVGRNNRLFKLLKFRSFAQDHTDHSGKRSVSPSDERMTRVGRFIRRTSLDELPQLFNVIAGDMSIVGPRPHALGSTAEDALFWKIDARYFHRHTVKPGMTGLAQVRGYRGATRQRRDLTNRLQSDLEYLCDWTIWRDLKIIVATFGVMLHPNAF